MLVIFVLCGKALELIYVDAQANKLKLFAQAMERLRVICVFFWKKYFPHPVFIFFSKKIEIWRFFSKIWNFSNFLFFFQNFFFQWQKPQIWDFQKNNGRPTPPSHQPLLLPKHPRPRKIRTQQTTLRLWRTWRLMENLLSNFKRFVFISVKWTSV